MISLKKGAIGTSPSLSEERWVVLFLIRIITLSFETSYCIMQQKSSTFFGKELPEPLYSFAVSTESPSKTNLNYTSITEQCQRCDPSQNMQRTEYSYMRLAVYEPFYRNKLLSGQLLLSAFSPLLFLSSQEILRCIPI